MLAAPAQAARVFVKGDQLYYVAAPGEVNDIGIVDQVGDRGYPLIFTGTPVPQAGHGCHHVVDGVVCVADGAYAGDEGFTKITAHLRDGDDRVRVSDPASYFAWTILDGGDGNDVLRNGNADGGIVYGRRGDDTISISHNSLAGTADGGPGNDTIAGGDAPGGWLYGRSGDDRIVASGQHVDGGTGADEMLLAPFGFGLNVIDYTTRGAPVHVSFDGIANDGYANEGDNVSILASDEPNIDMPLLWGGNGPDTLDARALGVDGRRGDDKLDYRGFTEPIDVQLPVCTREISDYPSPEIGRDPCFESMIGTDNADTIHGSSAANKITPGSGADTVHAAGGADVIDARDGTRDEIACGAGHDTLLRDSADPRPASCEKIVS